MSLEPIIRPFTTRSVTPAPYYQPGAIGVAPVHVRVGFPGGSKTFSTSMSATATFKMGHVQSESAPSSGHLQEFLSKQGK